MVISPGVKVDSGVGRLSRSLNAMLAQIEKAFLDREPRNARCADLFRTPLMSCTPRW